MFDEVTRFSANARRFSSDATVEWLPESSTTQFVNELVELIKTPLCGLRKVVTDVGGHS